MNGKERIKKALNHEEPDRVPFDFGGARACKITYHAYKNLLNYLGLKVENIQITRYRGLVAKVDEIVFERLGGDARPLFPKMPSEWKRDIHEEDDSSWYIDEWQRKRRLSKNGDSYEIMSFPLSKTPLESFKWPNPADPARMNGLKESARESYERTGAAIIGHPMNNGFMTEALLLYGFEKWLVMLAKDPIGVEAFLDKLLEFKIQYWDAFLSAAGDTVDVICEADDYGTQKGPLVSVSMYRKYMKPRQEKLFSFIKKKYGVKVFLHSCGSVYDLIPDFIEAGIDILNPIQASAAKMDPRTLKKEFGKDIVFWGGIDTQRVLPYGTPEEVKEEVRRRIDELAVGGGYVLASVHNITSEVPPQNIVAMAEAVHEYGKY
jgi:uroporphyrinogen decarboxylase